jgi:hypothetical protein
MFYYVFKFLAKLFLPLLLKKVVQKLEKILNSSSAMLKIILGKDIHQGRSNFNTAKSKNPREKLKKWVNMLITKK